MQFTHDDNRCVCEIHSFPSSHQTPARQWNVVTDMCCDAPIYFQSDPVAKCRMVLFSSGIDFHADAAGVVDSVEQQPQAILGNVTVCGFTCALPVTVVIDDENTADTKSGVQVDEFVIGGIEPVGVQPE